MHLNQTFGIEIECIMPNGASRHDCASAVTARLGSPCVVEGYNHRTQGYWKIVTDGSLGDMTHGIEVVSPVLSGEAGLNAIRAVMAALTDFGCTVNTRCGLHVHVGAGNPDMAFFRNLMKLYRHFEPAIDACMPASRRGSANIYCRTLTGLAHHTIDAARNLDTLLHALTPDIHRQRFHKLNLAAFRRQPTVEFRQHGGTVDGEKAVQWTLFCLRMVEAARSGPTLATPTASAVVNRARIGSKAWRVGQMMLSPTGVSRGEAAAAMGWPSISLPQQALICGLAYTTSRLGREVRYYANGATTQIATPSTLGALLTFIGCTPAEADYWRGREVRFSGGRVAMAA